MSPSWSQPVVAEALSRREHEVREHVQEQELRSQEGSSTMTRHPIIATISSVLALGAVVSGTLSSHTQRMASPTICPMTAKTTVSRAVSSSILPPPPQPCPGPLPGTE